MLEADGISGVAEARLRKRSIVVFSIAGKGGLGEEMWVWRCGHEDDDS